MAHADVRFFDCRLVLAGHRSAVLQQVIAVRVVEHQEPTSIGLLAQDGNGQASNAAYAAPDHVVPGVAAES